MPFTDVEVGVEVIGQRVPRDDLPPHPRLQALDFSLRSARDERDRGIAGVQMGGVGDLIDDPRAAGAGTLRPAVDARLEEDAVHDQLTASLE
jgi:hypothetical protein